MKNFALAALVSLLPAAAFAQKPLPTQNLTKEWVETEFPSDGELYLDLQSGGVRLTGIDGNRLRVRSLDKRGDEGRQAKVKLVTSGAKGDLSIWGGPKNNFEFEIEIPKRTHITVRMPAGELRVDGVSGNKDVRVHAGEVRIQVEDPEAYQCVNASVWAGEIHGGPFGEGKEGLFRSFYAEGKGHYSLSVRLKAGEVSFKK